MKKKLTVFFLFALAIGLNLANAKESLVPIETQYIEVVSQKVYLEPSQIFLSNQGIFILEDGGLQPVNAIRTDAKGIFAERYGYWKCPRCGRENDLGSCDCADDDCDYSLPYKTGRVPLPKEDRG